VVADNQADLDLMSNTLIRYHNCPVVCFVGSGLTVGKEFAYSKVLSQTQVHSYIKNEIAKVKADIKKIFDAFDTDKSGFIDKAELKGVAAGLGIGMGEIDCENMIRDLDLNKDGKISPEEFNLWWLGGRKGSTGKMSQLLAAKLGGKAFFSTLNGSLKALATQAQQGSYPCRKSSVEFNFNMNNNQVNDKLQAFCKF
jgi:hypothetical protein